MTMRGLHLASAALGVIALVGLTSNQAQAGAFAFADLAVNTFEIQSVSGLGGALGGELTQGTNILVTSANDSFADLAAIGGTNASSTTNGVAACVGACP